MMHATSEDSMDFVDSSTSSEGEEIWEVPDSEAEGENDVTNETVQKLLYGLTLFLSSFHILPNFRKSNGFPTLIYKNNVSIPRKDLQFITRSSSFLPKVHVWHSQIL